MHTNARFNSVLLKTLRTRLGHSQMDIARLSGLSLQTIIKLEKNPDPGVTLDTLNRIAKTFGCEVTQLLTPNSFDPAGRNNVELLRRGQLSNPNPEN